MERAKKARDSIERIHPNARRFWGYLALIALGVGIGYAGGYSGSQNPLAIALGIPAGIGRSFIVMIIIVMIMMLVVWRKTLLRLPSFGKRRKTREEALSAFASTDFVVKYRDCWARGVDQVYAGQPDTPIFPGSVQERARKEGYQTAVRMGVGK